MSDRLALADAIEDADIERAKASGIASVIFDALHQHVATKADLEVSAASCLPLASRGHRRPRGQVRAAGDRHGP